MFYSEHSNAHSEHSDRLLKMILNLSLTCPVNQIPLVGPYYAKKLERLEIFTVEDFLHHYPTRYIDFSLVVPISSIQEGELITIQGTVYSFSNAYTKRRLTIQKAVITDDTGKLEAVWFNQPFLKNTFLKNAGISISGKVLRFGNKLTLQSPEWEMLKEDVSLNNSIHTGRLVPIYPETEGVSSKWLRRKIAYLLQSFNNQLPEFLPLFICKHNTLIPYKQAMQWIHFPANFEDVQHARKRLGFDELFLIKLTSQIRKREWRKLKTTVPLSIKPKILQIQTFINNLPFTLTQPQIKSYQEILADFESNAPMNRLLQGDVGSGKTVVALITMYAVKLNNLGSILMAPTEILARQHYETIKLLTKNTNVSVGLYTGSTKDKGEYDILIGTHALLNHTNLSKTAFVVIDEQHRFGVEQRAKLQSFGNNPHLLTMTATPIPRSIALILHSELDLSYLDQLPKGRIKIKTWLVPELKRTSAYAWIENQIRTGKLNKKPIQCFIICPLIEESEHESMASIRAVKKEFIYLKEKIFPHLSLELLHGRMKSKDKNTILSRFSKSEFDILVSTPVVEVGIDIPSATIMVIEGAERFGLAQLHQLRGRVGRSSAQSYCLLFSTKSESRAKTRLKKLETIYDGAKLSLLDLSYRGAGDLYGTRQHGFNTLKIASLTDEKLINEVSDAVFQIFVSEPLFPHENLSQFEALRIKTLQTIIQNIKPN